MHCFGDNELSYLVLLPSSVVRRCVPHNVDLRNQHSEAYHHRDGNNRQVHACELKATHSNVLATQNIAPQHTSERSAECHAESSVVDADSHTVDCAPERSV